MFFFFTTESYKSAVEQIMLRIFLRLQVLWCLLLLHEQCVALCILRPPSLAS